MLRMKTLLLTLFTLTLATFTNAQRIEKKVFFVGNSYTNYNNLPNLVNQIAISFGDTLVYNAHTPGGSFLSQHAVNANVQSTIKQGNWDHVVLQDQSQNPSFPDPQRAADCYPYGQQLADSIHKYNPCGKAMFFMTWGRKDGDPQWGPISTFTGMNNRLRNAYVYMSDANKATVSPVGVAWARMRDSFPNVELYTADKSHPSFAGSYLAACTFYASIYRKSPVGSSYKGSLPDSTTQRIQRIVNQVVFDSIATWNIADYDLKIQFSAQVNQDTAQFISLTNDTTVSYVWDFGDNTPFSYDSLPVHIYSQNGPYTVKLNVEDGCGRTDSFQLAIQVNKTISTLLNTAASQNIEVFPNPSNGVLHFSQEVSKAILFNTSGQMIQQTSSPTQQLNLESLPTGNYWLQLTQGNRVPTMHKIILK